MRQNYSYVFPPKAIGASYRFDSLGGSCLLIIKFCIMKNELTELLAKKRKETNDHLIQVVTYYNMGLISFREHLYLLGEIANSYDVFLIKTIEGLVKEEGETFDYWKGYINAIEVI